MPRRLYRALLVLVVAVAPACGGSADPGSPAEAAPAGAFVYGEATVRPQGEAGESARALLRQLLGEDDPGRAIDDLFEDDRSSATFSDDVEPWLGERIGGFVSTVEPEAEAAVLASLRGLAARLGEGASLSIRRTARGVRITDPGLPRPIEVEDRGGRLAGAYGASPSAVASPRTRLTDSSGFMKARAQLGEGFEPTVYVSVPPLLGLLRGLGVGEGLDVSGAAAYLVQLDSVIQGERVEGDRLVTRTVVGLRP